MYPIRGAVTFKSPVGTNVAADVLANPALGRWRCPIAVGEDYGEGRLMQKLHAFAMKSQIGCSILPDLESIVKVEDGSSLEASNTPVMLGGIRACHAGQS